MTDARGRWPEPMPSRRDLAIGAALTVVSMAVVTWLSRDSWFYGDFWDFLLGRSLADPITLLEPHNGHLQFPVALVQQALYRTVGFDYWPWYWLPRVIGYGAMTYFMWIVIRRRGADPTVSWIAFGTLLILGSSAVINATTLGPFLVLPMVALAASIYSGGGPRRGSELVVFSALIVGLVITTSSGLAGAAALGLVGLALGRFRQIWPAFVAGLAVYSAWFVTFRGEGAGTGSLGFDSLADVPAALPEMFGAAISRALAVPLAYAPAVAVGVVLLLILWGARSKLDAFDAVWLLMAALYMTMVIVARVAPGRLDPDAVRFSFVATWLLVPAIVPHIRLPEDLAARRILVIGAVGLVVLGNLKAFRDESNHWEEISRAVESHVNAVGTLLLDGEPALEDSELVLPAGGGARRGLVTVASVKEFLEQGWTPTGPEDEESATLARGVLRTRVSVGGTASGASSSPLVKRSHLRPTTGRGAGRPSLVDCSDHGRMGRRDRIWTPTRRDAGPTHDLLSESVPSALQPLKSSQAARFMSASAIAEQCARP